MTERHRTLVMLLVAVVCFGVGFLIAVHLIFHGSYQAWVAAGLVAMALSRVSEKH